MDDLDALRAKLTPDQRRLLSAIWSHYLNERLWIPTRVLHSTVVGGKHIARPLLERLGGKVVYEREESGGSQYALTFLGVMLSSDGDRAEKLLTSYIRVARQLALQEPARTKVTSREVGEHLGLTSEELTFLGRVFMISPAAAQLTGGWSFGSDNQWEVVLPGNIEDWPDDPRQTIREAALRDYDPSVPLSPNEQAAYYPAKMRRGITQEEAGSRPAQPIVDSKVEPGALIEAPFGAGVREHNMPKGWKPSVGTIIGLASLLIACIAVVASVTVPEIRRLIGLDVFVKQKQVLSTR